MQLERRLPAAKQVRNKMITPQNGSLIKPRPPKRQQTAAFSVAVLSVALSPSHLIPCFGQWNVSASPPARSGSSAALKWHAAPLHRPCPSISILNVRHDKLAVFVFSRPGLKARSWSICLACSVLCQIVFPTDALQTAGKHALAHGVHVRT